MAPQPPPGDGPPVDPPVDPGPRPAPLVERRRWSDRIPLAGLWLGCVITLLLATGTAAAYLLVRQPEVVERAAPPQPPAEPSPEAVRRAEALRELNQALEAQLGTLKNEIEKPQCPPGSAFDTSAEVGATPLPAAVPDAETSGTRTPR